VIITLEKSYTINRWYGIFRQVIYSYQTALKDKLLGKVEVDERNEGAKRHRGYHGMNRPGFSGDYLF
jgi:hypothetical protein